jgi:hypothetical protein
VPAGGKQNTYARQQRRRRRPPPPMVPHGPGGQMLRPAPRHPYIPPSARARNRPRAGGRLFHPAPALPSRPRPSARQRAKAQERSYRSQGQAVERTANRQRRIAAARRRAARRYITQNPIRGLARSEFRAILALSDLQQSNPQRYAQNLHSGPWSDVKHFLSGPAKIQAAAPLQSQAGFTGARAVARDALSTARVRRCVIAPATP